MSVKRLIPVLVLVHVHLNVCADCDGFNNVCLFVYLLLALSLFHMNHAFSLFAGSRGEASRTLES